MQIHRRNGTNPAKMSEVRRVYILPQECAWTIWSTNVDALFIHICTTNFKISRQLLTLIHSPVLLLHPAPSLSSSLPTSGPWLLGKDTCKPLGATSPTHPHTPRGSYPWHGSDRSMAGTAVIGPSLTTTMSLPHDHDTPPTPLQRVPASTHASRPPATLPVPDPHVPGSNPCVPGPNPRIPTHNDGFLAPSCATIPLLPPAPSLATHTPPRRLPPTPSLAPHPVACPPPRHLPPTPSHATAAPYVLPPPPITCCRCRHPTHSVPLPPPPILCCRHLLHAATTATHYMLPPPLPITCCRRRHPLHAAAAATHYMLLLPPTHYMPPLPPPITYHHRHPSPTCPGPHRPTPAPTHASQLPPTPSCHHPCIPGCHPPMPATIHVPQLHPTCPDLPYTFRPALTHLVPSVHTRAGPTCPAMLTPYPPSLFARFSVCLPLHLPAFSVHPWTWWTGLGALSTPCACFTFSNALFHRPDLHFVARG